MVSSGTGISDKMELLRTSARVAVDSSIPYASRIMPITICHSIVQEFIQNDEDDLLDDDEYNFAVALMNELAEQANIYMGKSDDNSEV